MNKLQQLDYIKTRFEAGATIGEIAASLNVIPQTVYTALDSARYDFRSVLAQRRANRVAGHEQQVRQLWMDNLTTATIAYKMGVSAATVRNRLQILGLPEINGAVSRRAAIPSLLLWLTDPAATLDDFIAGRNETLTCWRSTLAKHGLRYNNQTRRVDPISVEIVQCVSPQTHMDVARANVDIVGEEIRAGKPWLTLCKERDWAPSSMRRAFYKLGLCVRTGELSGQ